MTSRGSDATWSIFPPRLSRTIWGAFFAWKPAVITGISATRKACAGRIWSLSTSRAIVGALDRRLSSLGLNSYLPAAFRQRRPTKDRAGRQADDGDIADEDIRDGSMRLQGE